MQDAQADRKRALRVLANKLRAKAKHAQGAKRDELLVSARLLEEDRYDKLMQRWFYITAALETDPEDGQALARDKANAYARRAYIAWMVGEVKARFLLAARAASFDNRKGAFVWHKTLPVSLCPPLKVID